MTTQSEPAGAGDRESPPRGYVDDSQLPEQLREAPGATGETGAAGDRSADEDLAEESAATAGQVPEPSERTGDDEPDVAEPETSEPTA